MDLNGRVDVIGLVVYYIIMDYIYIYIEFNFNNTSDTVNYLYIKKYKDIYIIETLYVLI